MIRHAPSLRRKVAALVSVIAVTLIGSACDSDNEPSVPPTPSQPSPTVFSEEAGVLIRDTAFVPATITVTEGTEITWVSEDQNVSHTVTSGEPGDRQELFDGELENEGTIYSVEFGTDGEYPYYCRIHNSMRGTVLVEAP